MMSSSKTELWFSETRGRASYVDNKMRIYILPLQIQSIRRQRGKRLSILGKRIQTWKQLRTPDNRDPFVDTVRVTRNKTFQGIVKNKRHTTRRLITRGVWVCYVSNVVHKPWIRRPGWRMETERMNQVGSWWPKSFTD